MIELMTAVGKAQVKPGDMLFNTENSTTSWTVPPGVTKISGIAISGGASGGGGGGSIGGGGGGGGGMVYFNDYPVNPGDVFSIFVGPVARYQYGNGQSGADVIVKKNGVELFTASGGQGGIKGSNGGAPGNGYAKGDLTALAKKVFTSQGQSGRGGASAGKGGVGGYAPPYDGQTMVNGQYQTPYGSNSSLDVTYGRGGTGGDNSNSSSSASRGCVRIFWGNDRSFPTNAGKI